MDSDQGKLFIGGISWETTEEKLSDYFGKYGDVLQTVVMRDKITGKPRGFGFVVFADPAIVDRVLQDTHTIDGRTVEAKRAMSREEQHTTVRSTNTNIPRNAVGSGGGGGGSGNFRTKKIFVGGLPPTLTDMEFREYFEAFGTVTDVVVMYDQNTQRPRGFGFVSFDSEDSVERVVQKQFHDVGGKAVEVKRALPKDANPNSTTNRSMGGGSYQSYGGGPGAGSGGNVNSYDNRMDASRYMQTPGSGAGYNPYGSSGYGAPAAYGYGSAANPVGYGGHGGYGGNGSYGNPSGPGTGYISGPPGAPRSPWNTQGPSGYGSAGYSANTGYGGAGSWNTPGTGGPGSGHTGQSPGTAASYGNQGYGYGGYAGSEGLYGNQTGYGAIGGRGGGGGGAHAGNSTATAGEQGAVAGFISAGGGYSDGSGTAGYSNTWRSDAPQGGNYGAGQVNAPGGTIGYGGGYGASQSRQAQQQ
ncbi:Heterogeneous nuclear ribonucleoprotein 1 [Platanthera guangdongensis]|uniref:Heterogeneous nuclear ribonucleoprotein 1 n=1 Tax=Platanthera guangdongensis TaxID=2320717 RepID=A0ABR2MS50_9ASPA